MDVPSWVKCGATGVPQVWLVCCRPVWAEHRLPWETLPSLHESGLQRLHAPSMQGRGGLKHKRLLCLGIGRGVPCMKLGLLRQYR